MPANNPNGTHPQRKAQAVGINHIALEVGDISAALDFYSQIFAFNLRGRHEGMAFIDLGDQFIALMEAQNKNLDEHRHFGLVVDDKNAVRSTLETLNIKILPGGFLNFIDPWGNQIQVVQYDDIQFTKAPQVLRGMNLSHLSKSAEAKRELAEKGMSLD